MQFLQPVLLELSKQAGFLIQGFLQVRLKFRHTAAGVCDFATRVYCVPGAAGGE